MVEKLPLDLQPQSTDYDNRKEQIVNKFKNYTQQVSTDFKNTINQISANTIELTNSLKTTMQGLKTKAQPLGTHIINTAKPLGPAAIDAPFYWLNTLKLRRQKTQIPIRLNNLKLIKQSLIGTSFLSLYQGFGYSFTNKFLSRNYKLNVQDYLNTKLQFVKPWFDPHIDQTNLNSAISFVSGCVASGTGTLLCYPIEKRKVGLQVNTNIERPPSFYENLKKSPLKATNKIFSLDSTKNIMSLFNKENLQNCYEGVGITATRDALAAAVFFSVYKRRLENRKSSTKKDQVIASAEAAASSAFASQPLDVVKTMAQTGDNSGFKNIFRNIYRQQGVLGFMRGIGPTLLHAPARVIGPFLVYEALKKNDNIQINANAEKPKLKT